MSKPYDDERFDAALRSHLTSELDPQRGRARRAFQAHVATKSAGQRHGKGVWFIGVAGAALAASLTALWVVPVFLNAPPPGVAHTQPVAPGPEGVLTPSTSPKKSASSDKIAVGWEQVDRMVRTRTVDDSLVVLDGNMPARVVRQIAMERTQWIDPERGVRVETVVPRERVTLIAMDTY